MSQTFLVSFFHDTSHSQILCMLDNTFLLFNTKDSLLYFKFVPSWYDDICTNPYSNHHTIRISGFLILHMFLQDLNLRINSFEKVEDDTRMVIMENIRRGFYIWIISQSPQDDMNQQIHKFMSDQDSIQAIKKGPSGYFLIAIFGVFL